MSDSDNDYSNQTDITFMLSGTITDQNGNSYSVSFPDAVCPGDHHSTKGRRRSWPADPEPAVRQRPCSSMMSNQDGQDYTYCLTIEPNMVSDEMPTCPLDPNIVNR